MTPRRIHLLLVAAAAVLCASGPSVRADSSAPFAPRRGRALPSSRRPASAADALVRRKRRQGELGERREEEGEKSRRQSSSSSSTLSVAPRGGAAPASQTAKELSGALYFTIADVLLRKVFRAADIAFPSQLGGCVILFFVMSLVQVLRPGWGDAASDLMAPGAAWLTRWMPVFFVPGLAMLPLAPSMGGPLEIVKVLGVVVIGCFYSLATTGFTVLTLRTMQGAIKTPEPESADKPGEKAVENIQKGGAAPSLPYSEESLSLLVKGSVLTGALSIAASRFNFEYAGPLQAVFMAFATFASYVWGARLPPAFTKIVHPLLTSTGIVLAVVRLLGLATGSPFEDVLQSYKTGTLDPLKTGAGDVLLFMLGPAVVSFGLAMYSRRKLMLDNALVVAAAIAVSSGGGLFGTAFFVKLINLGGKAGKDLRLSMLPRNVTTPLAIAIINIIGGNIAIACSIVVLTGIFGATVGARAMTAWGIEDPVSRGLGVGAAGQGLGVASMAGEKDAFPFAALSMVLTALAATTLVSIPAVKDALLRIVGEAPAVAEAVKEAAASATS